MFTNNNPKMTIQIYFNFFRFLFQIFINSQKDMHGIMKRSHTASFIVVLRLEVHQNTVHQNFSNLRIILNNTYGERREDA